MYYKLLLATLIVMLTSVSVVNSMSVMAGDSPVLRIKLSSLEAQPLAAGPLRITIRKLRGSVLKLGSGYIEAEIHNASDEFVTYSPARLSFVNRDLTQVDIFGRAYGQDVVALRDRRLVPRAVINEYYRLDNRIELPCRVYYEDKLLAEIIE